MSIYWSSLACINFKLYITISIFQVIAPNAELRVGYAAAYAKLIGKRALMPDSFGKMQINIQKGKNDSWLKQEDQVQI